MTAPRPEPYSTRLSTPCPDMGLPRTDHGRERDSQPLGAAELAVTPDGVEDRQDFQGEERAGDEAAEHGRGDPAHDLGARAFYPEQRQEAGRHGRHRHQLGAEPTNRPLRVRLDDVVPAADASLREPPREG